MSMELMVKAMKCKVGNPLRKLVLIKLADNANDQGECWPSYQHIADQCEIGKSTVRKHIKDLETSGLLKIENRKGPKGNASNIYRLTLNGVSPDSTGVSPDSTGVSPDSTGVSPDSTGVSPDSTGVSPDSTPPVAPDSTGISHSFEPVNDPVNEQGKTNQKNKTAFPSDFQITEKMRGWYQSKEFNLSIEDATESWSTSMIAGGYKYVDWEAAWRNGVKNQNKWELRGQKSSARSQGVNYVGSNFTAPQGWEEFK
ncbi:helix-turn-helix domain-containing protein [Vibrio fluvialis]|nr:helix-turn-helix domain-containing protein [Vibrio fluvialis]